MVSRFDDFVTKKILLFSVALVAVTVGSLSVYLFFSKKQTDDKSKETSTDIAVITKSIQLDSIISDTTTDDTKVIAPTTLQGDLDTTTQTTIDDTTSRTTSTLLNKTLLQTSRTVKSSRVSSPKRLSPRAYSKSVQKKPTIVLEDFDSSFDSYDDGLTEADISEAYVNLARMSVLENESPKRRAARAVREEKARIEMENKTIQVQTQTNKSDFDIGKVEEERRQLSNYKTAASQAAVVASVHLLAHASGGRSLRSPLRGESRAMTQSKLVDTVEIDHSTTSPKKLSEEFASVASPSKVGARRQILAEMKVRRYY